MKEELKVTNWIKFMRVTEAALQTVFTEAKWQALRDEHEYKQVSLEAGT